MVRSNKQQFKFNENLTHLSNKLTDNYNRIELDICSHKHDKYEQMLLNRLNFLKDEIMEITIAGR